MDFMEFFQAFLLVLGVVLKLASGYFLAVSLFALRRARPFPDAYPETRFAVVIAARNEETVIANLVKSLLAQHYPRGLFDVIVVPNNCTDGTENAARLAGARIMRCENPVRRKGDVLNEVFAKLMKYSYDAFVVFDADNIAEPNSLAEMNRAFAAGAEVCKGRIMAKNPYTSATSGCYTLHFEMSHLFLNRARAACGLSAKINGTGFAVSRKALERLGGWNTQTITEDAEFTAQLAHAGIRATYVPRAITYDEQPTSPAVSVTQRLRWCGGIVSVAKLTVPPALAKRPTALLFDSIMTVTTPYFQAAGAIPAAYSLFAALAGGAPTFAAFAAQLALAYAALAVFAAATAAIAGYSVPKMLRGIAAYPLFLASWVPIQVYSVFRQTSEWRQIRHSSVENLSVKALR
ncbi:MAG: glycosyltransferase family 2 protein [Oscillospiraceae bacterium]|jgi:cellulose synthase/poly-beta-1,6-N-acetylglucosamine synthase-like glycosyltransferase|nr:glycosyltransferase family 2 protein [Oscillospiraceae bacterium]